MRAKLLTRNLRCSRSYRREVREWDANYPPQRTWLFRFRLNASDSDAMFGSVLIRDASGGRAFRFKEAA